MIIGFWKNPMNKKQLLKGFYLLIFSVVDFYLLFHKTFFALRSY